MNALFLRNTNFIFNWLSHQTSMISAFGLRKGMNIFPKAEQEEEQQSGEDTQQQNLNELLQGAFDFTNRNARSPKKSNHGARPCSSVMRRLKKKYYYRRTKEAMTPEMEPKKKFDI